MRILIFGDSIAHGVWDERGGWVQRMRSQYDTHSLKNLGNEYPDFYNLSISGETAQGVVRRLPYEVKSRQIHEPTCIIIAIGMNDTMIYKGVESTPAELFADELRQILESAQQFTDKILFVGLTAVDDKLCNPWPYSKTGKCYHNERIWEFEQVIRKFCKDNTIPAVKIFEKFQKQHTKSKLLSDGLHPNDAGHKFISSLVSR